MFKSTLLLAIALFLITAPAPDSADIAEATHGLMSDNGAAALQAAETPAPCDDRRESGAPENLSAPAGCADERAGP